LRFILTVCTLFFGQNSIMNSLTNLAPRWIGESTYCLVGSHLSVDEPSHLVTFHKQECPHDLSLIIHKLGGCKSDVQIAQVEKGPAFRAIPSKIIWSCWLDMMAPCLLCTLCKGNLTIRARSLILARENQSINYKTKNKRWTLTLQGKTKENTLRFPLQGLELCTEKSVTIYSKVVPMGH
jgi:hypothetical protein